MRRCARACSNTVPLSACSSHSVSRLSSRHPRRPLERAVRPIHARSRGYEKVRTSAGGPAQDDLDDRGQIARAKKMHPPPATNATQMLPRAAEIGCVQADVSDAKVMVRILG